MTRPELIVAALTLACWLAGFLLLADGNLSGRGRRLIRGVGGAFLVSSGVWLAMALAFMVGTR